MGLIALGSTFPTYTYSVRIVSISPYLSSIHADGSRDLPQVLFLCTAVGKALIYNKPDENEGNVKMTRNLEMAVNE